MSESLAALVRTYLEEPLRLVPGDAAAERGANTAWYGIPAEPVEPHHVVAALHEVGRLLGARFRDAPAPVTFYAWYDEQAGQLRCSLRSLAPDDLPFGARHEQVEVADPVVALIAADEHPGRVPWSELTQPDGDEAEVGQEPFPVYVVRVA